MNDFFGYGSTSSSNAPARENTPLAALSEVGKVVGAKANELKDNTVKITDGIADIDRQNPSSYRTWKIVSGLLMMASSIYSFIKSSVVDYDTSESVLALYSFFFGFLICVMEPRTFLLPESWKDRMYDLCKMLSYTWGKGAYFVSVGVFQFSQGDYALDFVAGFFTFLVGLLCLSTSHGANRKLRQLHACYSSRAELQSSLESFNSGEYMNRMNLRHFFATNGISLSSHELEAVFDFFDSDKNEVVSQEDFCLWYDALSQTIVSNDPPMLV